jgi:hypothetical protein
MNRRPSSEEATEAERAMSEAILKFSDEARAPWERGKPNPDPLWKPRVSTLRYSPLRKGGWIWSMDANDSQIVAFYVVASDGNSFVQVTAHGQSRHNFHEMLRTKHLYPTLSPWIEWYDFRTQYDLDAKMRKKVVW